MNVISFSGGKDSTAMLLMMIEKKMPIDKVIFVDTTKEFPAMYKHIEKVKKYIAPLEITTISIKFDYYFSEHIKTKGKIGEIGYGWPNILNRWCTARKRDTINKCLKGIPKNSINRFIGIAYDEIKRMKHNKSENLKYPLVDWKMTEADCLAYCHSKGFDWDGLYDKFARVSCWCCPLSRICELRTLYNDFPELWKELQEMDEKTFRQFRMDYSVDRLTAKFENDNKQMKLNF